MDEKLNDSKIELKTFKEKKTHRTYIYNLDKFVTDGKKVEEIISNLKKKVLATSCIEKEAEPGAGAGAGAGAVVGGKIYGFQGEHGAKIKKYLIDNNFVKDTDFKI